MTSYNWREFLYAAYELCGREGAPLASEYTLYLIAIGRAYYAAFNMAREFLRDHDHINVPRQSVHEFVAQQFRDSTNARRRKIGYTLYYMRNIRNVADYNGIIVNIEEEVNDMIDRAERVLSLLKQVEASDSRLT